MKCPLFAMFQPFACRKQGISDYDCLKEECAWWDEETGLCSVKVLAFSSSYHQRALDELRWSKWS
jgi:hypothetical protein